MDLKDVFLSCYRHQEFVENSIRNFGAGEPDVILISENGKEVYTNKMFLSLFTSLVKDICPPGQKVTVFNVPFSEESLALLLQFLTTGSVTCQEEKELELVMELMECLAIKKRNMKVKAVETKTVNQEKFDPAKHVDEFFYFTPRRKTSNKINRSSKETAPGTKNVEEEKKDNPGLDDSKVKEEYSYLDEDLTKPDLSFQSLTEKKSEKSTEMPEIKKEAITISENCINEDNQDKQDKKTKWNVCTICEKQFKSRNYLEQHKVTHIKEKPYECRECGKRFGTRAILYNHAGVHNPTHQCEVCHIRFGQKGALILHIKKKHPSADTQFIF